MSFNSRDISARQKEALKEINREALEVINREHLELAMQILHACQAEIEDGGGDGDTLMRIAEASIDVGRMLESVAKVAAATAIGSGTSVRDVTRRLRVGSSTISKLQSDDFGVDYPREDGWWCDMFLAPEVREDDNQEVPFSQDKGGATEAPAEQGHTEQSAAASQPGLSVPARPTNPS